MLAGTFNPLADRTANTGWRGCHADTLRPVPRFAFSRLGRPRKLRATDADRDAYGNIVSKAFSEGQLDATAFEYRSSKVLNAKTVGELDDLVADLVTPETADFLVTAPGPVAVASVKRQLKIVGAVTLAAIVASGLIAAGTISAGTESTSIQPVFPGIDIEIPALDWQPQPSIDMYSPAGLQQVVDDIVAAAGSPDLTWLGLYGEYALASGPAAPGATRLATHDWRDREVTTSAGSETLDEAALFDVTTGIDVAAIASLAAGAAQLTGVTDPTSLYVSIDRSLFSADRQVEVRVSLSNEYQDGYLTADHLGEIITIEGPGVEPDTTRFYAAAGASKALEALRSRLAHDEVTELRFYGEYVAAEAPPEPGATVVDSYEYRGGSIAAKQTNTPVQPEDVRAAVFSLDTVDGAVVADAISRALTAAELPDGEVSFAYVQRPRRPVGHDPVVVVVVFTKYESAEVIFSLTGELLQVS